MSSSLIKDMFQRTLVISPHCDDEVIGCGGLMRKIVKHGGNVTVAIVATGDTMFYHVNRVVTAEEREEELKDSLACLGVGAYRILFSDKESIMDTVSIKEVVTAFDYLLQEIRPTAVLIPYPSFHQDHKVTFDASFAALRPSPTYVPKLVGMYEYPFVTWSYERLNGGALYVDISEEIQDKVNALRKHASQIREGRHAISPETIELWAERRGLEASIEYAELYRVLRMIA